MNEIDEIIAWTEEKYQTIGKHTSEITGSTYLKILQNDFQVCEIRFSSHLATKLSADLIIVKCINNKNFMVYMKVSTMPMYFNLEELKKFIEFFVLIKYSEKVADKTKKAMQEKEKEDEKIKQKTTPFFNDSFICNNKQEFNNPEYRKANWKFFKKEYLEKRYANYTTFKKGIQDTFRKIYIYYNNKKDLSLQTIEKIIKDKLNEFETLDTTTINNCLQYVYSKNIFEADIAPTNPNFILNFEKRVQYKHLIENALIEKNNINEFSLMTKKQKDVIIEALMQDIKYIDLVNVINEANKYGRDIRKMKKAVNKLLKTSNQ